MTKCPLCKTPIEGWLFHFRRYGKAHPYICRSCGISLVKKFSISRIILMVVWGGAGSLLSTFYMQSSITLPLFLLSLGACLLLGVLIDVMTTCLVPLKLEDSSLSCDSCGLEFPLETSPDILSNESEPWRKLCKNCQAELRLK